MLFRTPVPPDGHEGSPVKKIIPAALIATAGAVVVGLIGMQAPAVAEEAVKRDDDAIELVLADDEDGDDTNNDDSTDAEDSSAPSLATNDNTNSRVSAVSRDRDISRSDLTKDFTIDGAGDQVRDLSANSTNDNSRSDTRR